MLTDPRGVIHDDGMDHVVSCEEGGCGALDATGLANGYADNLDCKFCVAGSKEALDAVSFARMMRADPDIGCACRWGADPWPTWVYDQSALCSDEYRKRRSVVRTFSFRKVRIRHSEIVRCAVCVSRLRFVRSAERPRRLQL